MNEQQAASLCPSLVTNTYFLQICVLGHTKVVQKNILCEASFENLFVGKQKMLFSQQLVVK